MLGDLESFDPLGASSSPQPPFSSSYLPTPPDSSHQRSITGPPSWQNDHTAGTQVQFCGRSWAETAKHVLHQTSSSPRLSLSPILCLSPSLSPILCLNPSLSPIPCLSLSPTSSLRVCPPRKGAQVIRVLLIPQMGHLPASKCSLQMGSCQMVSGVLIALYCTYM